MDAIKIVFTALCIIFIIAACIVNPMILVYLLLICTIALLLLFVFILFCLMTGIDPVEVLESIKKFYSKNNTKS